jgi:uncharacterized protein
MVSLMQSRLLVVFLMLAVGGCVAPRPAPILPQAATEATRAMERALELVFGPLDQESTSLNWVPPVAGEPAVADVMAPALTELQTRMQRRLELSDALKIRGTVGEDFRGYLEARVALQPADEKIVSDENADRREVYSAIAAREKINAEQVGRLRAQKIALTSTRGIWLQAGDGVWDQKP